MARRGRGSEGYDEKTTIPTLFPINWEPDEMARPAIGGATSKTVAVASTSPLAKQFGFTLILALDGCLFRMPPSHVATGITLEFHPIGGLNRL